VNPIVHGELSWLVSQPLASKRDRGLVTLAGLVPDIDGLSLLGGVDAYATYHHLLTHGLVAAAVTALGCAALARDKLRTAGLALVSFHLHVVCDLAGSGPGWPVLYFWPMSRHEWMWAWQWDLASCRTVSSACWRRSPVSPRRSLWVGRRSSSCRSALTPW